MGTQVSLGGLLDVCPVSTRVVIRLDKRVVFDGRNADTANLHIGRFYLNGAKIGKVTLMQLAEEPIMGIDIIADEKQRQKMGWHNDCRT